MNRSRVLEILVVLAITAILIIGLIAYPGASPAMFSW